MTKKAIESETKGQKNKVLKRHIDLTGSNIAQTLDKCPVDKSPPFLETLQKKMVYTIKQFATRKKEKVRSVARIELEPIGTNSILF